MILLALLLLLRVAVSQSPSSVPETTLLLTCSQAPGAGLDKAQWVALLCSTRSQLERLGDAWLSLWGLLPSVGAEGWGPGSGETAGVRGEYLPGRGPAQHFGGTRGGLL